MTISVEEAAQRALQIKMIEVRLEKERKEVINPILVKDAEGKTKHHQVPGVGKVTVTKKGDEPKWNGEYKYSLNIESFQSLSMAERAQFISSGLINEIKVMEGGSEPQVRCSLSD